MHLSVAERIHLLGLLPQSGNLLTMKIVRDLRGELGFSEKELKEWEIANDGDNISWNDQVQEKDIEVGEKTHQMVADALKALDENGGITEQHLSLCDKFLLVMAEDEKDD